jgi:hypothetical protein
VDILGKTQLRPETKAKIKKTREVLDKDLKEELMKEKNEVNAYALFSIVLRVTLTFTGHRGQESSKKKSGGRKDFQT